MRNRWGWAWWALAFVVVGVGVYVVYQVVRPPQSDGEAAEKWQQIQLGMTQRQVANLVGPQHPSRVLSRARSGGTWIVEVAWRIGDDKIVVQFDEVRDRADVKWAVLEGYIIRDPEIVSAPAKQPWWDRLRDRLGL